MKLTLSGKDRIIIMEVLPKRGNMLQQMLAVQIGKKLELTSDEIERFDLKHDGGKLYWDQEKIKETADFIFTEAELQLIKNEIKKLDEAEAIKSEYVETFLKIQ